MQTIKRYRPNIFILIFLVCNISLTDQIYAATVTITSTLKGESEVVATGSVIFFDDAPLSSDGNLQYIKDFT